MIKTQCDGLVQLMLLGWKLRRTIVRAPLGGLRHMGSLQSRVPGLLLKKPDEAKVFRVLSYLEYDSTDAFVASKPL